MKYAILVREHQSGREVELCEVGNNPDAIVAALRKKKLKDETVGKSFPQYLTVRWIEKNGDLRRD
jgi:hypothetical protein